MKKLITALLLTSIATLANAECKVEEFTWEMMSNGGIRKVTGMTNCPDSRMDVAFYCDDVFLESDWTYTKGIGNFRFHPDGT
jgi:hypothetical protein